MIVALSGRRIDAPDARQPRFPLDNVGLVAQRIRLLFEEQKPRVLVCAAANGADLLALEAAGDLSIERHIILPFPPEIFRTTSVIDRPGPWGERFDRLLSHLGSKEQVVSLGCSTGDETAYEATNRAILQQAQLRGGRMREAIMAVLVWNGSPRGEQDNTLQFQKAALKIGLPIREILTL
jgi:hypothetical protein